MELDSTKYYVRQLEKVLADRDQEIHRLKRKSPSFVKRTSPHLKGRAGFPSLNGNTPLSRVSFFGCTTSTPNDFANIAAGCLDNRRRNNVGGNAGTAGEFDFLSQQRAMEEVVAGGPSFIPNTPALLGLPADTRFSFLNSVF
uniref:Uncharacterized protein n=1 Tax=Meloidogyne floridensis TaxID=298350 RepID=A0A915NQM0_9BILA